MHARSVPGSHLVLRVPAGKEASQEDIQFAADLSVFFSKSRTATRWDVTVCSGKDVKKPKGSKPGQVMVMNERVVSGVPDQSAAAKEEHA
jgi:predicted ribosome quality control (RQC) complex YloA/Tae2 family protein